MQGNNYGCIGLNPKSGPTTGPRSRPKIMFLFLDHKVFRDSLHRVALGALATST